MELVVEYIKITIKTILHMFKKAEESMNIMKRKIKNILKTPNQISRDKSITTGMKTPLYGINTLDTAEEKLSILENIAIETGKK